MQTLTHKNILITIVTSFHIVVGGESIPMALLVLGEHSRTFAQRTQGPESAEDGGSYEFRSVGYILDGLKELIVHFKGNDTLLFLHVTHLS